jgi:hypothetical protein
MRPLWLLHCEQSVGEVRAADAGASTSAPTGNRGPPSLLVRVASAFMYIVPWIDILGLGREVYHFFNNALLLYLIPGAPQRRRMLYRRASPARTWDLCVQRLHVHLVPGVFTRMWCFQACLRSTMTARLLH